MQGFFPHVTWGRSCCPGPIGPIGHWEKGAFEVGLVETLIWKGLEGPLRSIKPSETAYIACLNLIHFQKAEGRGDETDRKAFCKVGILSFACRDKNAQSWGRSQTRLPDLPRSFGSILTRKSRA